MAAAALLVAAVGFALCNVWATFSRSLIPTTIEGPVERVEVRREKHPGVDDVWLVHVGGRRLHVDAQTAAQLETGLPLRKQAWRRTLFAGGRPIPLHVSAEATGMLLVMPLTLVSAAAAAWSRTRPRRQPASSSSRRS